MSAGSLVGRRWFEGLVVGAAVVTVALIVSVLVIGPWVKTGAGGPIAKVENSLQLSRGASVARWAAMGDYYTAQAQANLQRGNDASAARWAALGTYYEAAGK